MAAPSALVGSRGANLAWAQAIAGMVWHAIEAMINQELGEPYRRDAMKKSVSVPV